MKKQQLSKLCEIKISKKLSVSIWFLPVALCAVFGGYSLYFFTAFIIAFFHELSHILAARFLHIGISGISIYPFGITARLRTNYIKSSNKEFLIAFLGPFFNILMFWFSALLMQKYPVELLKFCADTNFAMAIINLFPALPLDGGRMLKSILVQKVGIIKAYNFMFRLSRIMICALGVCALTFLFLNHSNFSIILITAFLLQNLANEHRCLSHITVKEILESSGKTEQKDSWSTKVICVSEDTRASVLLRHLSYDYYCVVLVADKNSRIIKTLSETQILKRLTKSGIMTRFCDIE